MFTKTLRATVTAIAAGVALTLGSFSAQAGSIYLTGHDVLLHNGQDGYDEVILDFLRGNGTTAEISRADYDIGYLTNGGTGGGLASLTSAVPSFGSITTADPGGFADATAFATYLSGIDVLVIPWIFDIGAADSAIINSYAPQIEDFFNAGGDIWANSSFTTTTFYDFLPPGAAATGPSISGSTGFTATAEGVAIGITSSMINGHPTHNSFTSFDSSFTVFETRVTSSGTEVISIGLSDLTIVDCDPQDPGSSCFSGGTPVPEPASLALLGLGLLGIGYQRRRRQQG